MRNALLVLVALVLVAGAWLLTRSLGVGDVALERSPPAAPAERLAAAVDLAPPELETETLEGGVGEDRRTGVDAETARALQVAAAGGLPQSVIRGRVVDERGRSVADADVQLRSVDGPWREGTEVPSFRFGPWSIEGWQVTTGTDGAFRFETPVPTSDWISLYVDAPRFRGLAARNFGPAGGRNEPRLAEGDNHLGDVVLTIAGSLTGSVRDGSGAPIERAMVRLEDEFPGELSVQTWSDGDGRYELDHLPPGTWQIGVQAEGWLSQVSTGHTVEAERALAGPEFRLAAAPRIAGVVVDEAGGGLAGVGVWGWPMGGGQGAGATTDAGGHFSIAIPQPVPYQIEVQDAAQYEPWGGHGDPDAVFEPGRDDVRIVLVHASRTTFVVVDDASGAPVERFVIEVEERVDGQQDSVSSTWVPPYETHADGRVSLRAEPVRHLVSVIAPDHAPLEAPVEHDPGTPGVQTLRLRAGGALAGRVVDGQTPLAAASLTLDGDPLPIDARRPFDPDDWFHENTRWDLGRLARRGQIAAADRDGRFRFDALAPGTYRLRVQGGDRAPRVLRGLAVSAGETLELGDVGLSAGASIRGRVVLVAGTSPVGLELTLDEFARETTIVTADGRFAFEGLAPGAHVLQLAAAPPILLEPLQVELDLVAGETRELVLDATDKAPCRVLVRIAHADGRPAAELVVEALRATERGHLVTAARVGTTDAEGVVRGVVPPGSPLMFVALSSGFAIGQSAPSDPLPDGSLETTLTVNGSPLVLQFPGSLELPVSGGFMLWLAPEGAPGAVVRRSTRWSTPAAPFPGAGKWTAHRCEVGLVAPGRYELRLDAWRYETDESTPGRIQLRQDPLFPHVARTIEIRAGETTVFEVPLP